MNISIILIYNQHIYVLSCCYMEDFSSGNVNKILKYLRIIKLMQMS